MSIVDELITDRTQADVDAVRELLLKVSGGTATAEELAQFNLAKEKGAYNYTDLNRVTQAMDCINERLTGYGYQTGYQKVEIPHATPQPVSPLPEGYTQLAYIESTGTQYVDTGFQPDQDTRVVCDVELLESDKAYGIFGSRIGYGNTSFDIFAFGTNGAQDFQDDYAQQTKAPLASSIGRFSIDKNKNVTTINGTESTFSQATFSLQYPMFLFGVSTSGSPNNQLGDLRVFSCQIYDNDELVRDFIPCRNPDGEVGLYDTVTGVFYGNDGTGLFLAGYPIVTLPEGYVQAEYIQSSGEQYIDTRFIPNQDTRVVMDFQLTAETNEQTPFLARQAAQSR